MVESEEERNAWSLTALRLLGERLVFADTVAPREPNIAAAVDSLDAVRRITAELELEPRMRQACEEWFSDAERMIKQARESLEAQKRADL